MTTFLRPQPAPLPAGGLDLVLRAGRRRRAVFTTSSGAVVAAVVAFALLTGSYGGTQSLTPAVTPPSRGPASAAAAPGAIPAAPGGTPQPVVASAVPSVPPSGLPSPAPLPGVPGSPSPSPTPPAGGRYPHHTAMRDGTGVWPPTAVALDDSEVWAVDATVTDKGATSELYLSLCNIVANNTTQTLDYRTVQEADFTVVDRAGREVWRWSRGQRFAAQAHSRSVVAGQCVWWATDWYRNGDDRRLLRAGTYTVRMYATVKGWSGSVAHTDVTIGS
jgi:hypothetical protein